MIDLDPDKAGFLGAGFLGGMATILRRYKISEGKYRWKDFLVDFGLLVTAGSVTSVVAGSVAMGYGMDIPVAFMFAWAGGAMGSKMVEIIWGKGEAMVKVLFGGKL